MIDKERPKETYRDRETRHSEDGLNKEIREKYEKYETWKEQQREKENKVESIK